MKHFLSILLFTACLLAISAQVHAQGVITKTVDYLTLTPDTLTNAETVTLADSRLVLGNYDLYWQTEATNISDTTSYTLYVESSNCVSCSDWVVRDSVVVTAASPDGLISITKFPGLRVRGRFVSTYTGVTALRNHLVWRDPYNDDN